MKKILYVSTFKDQYDEDIFIQNRKKTVLKHFERNTCEIHFLHNSPGSKPLCLQNGKSFYHGLLYCNVAENRLKRMHNLLFKYSSFYSKLIIRNIAKILPMEIDYYDLIVTESWEIAFSFIPFVHSRKIIVRIYGTTDLTERIEQNNFWKLNPFFKKIEAVINAGNIKKIIFNSTGSRSRDLFEMLSQSDQGPQPVYLDMPNVLFPMQEEKKRMVNGVLHLLHVGRMIENRGFDLTLKVVDILRRTYQTPVRAVLVGDGRVRDALREMCRQLDLSDCVHFPGKMDLGQLKRYYAKADILMNCYGFNPVIEGLNFKVFAITREFGEMQSILDRYYSDKVFKVCVEGKPLVYITKEIKDDFVIEAVSVVRWYSENCKSITDNDYIPKVAITLEDFGKQVFQHYHDALSS